jgi:hypothetical protein
MALANSSGRVAREPAGRPRKRQPQSALSQRYREGLLQRRLALVLDVRKLIAHKTAVDQGTSVRKPNDPRS